MNQSVLKDKLNSKAWTYLPDAYTFSQYFNQSDLIEISKVCKNYRAQLKSQVRKKLLISHSIIKLLNIRSLSDSHGYEDVINCLRLDFSGDYHLVKQVIINIGISKKFALDFFNLFSKLSNIQILICKRYDLKSYIEILNSLENLQYITLSSEYKNFDSILDNERRSFFYRLKSIEIFAPSPIVSERSPLDIIDSSFTNLENLTIVNNNMLFKLSNGISSLLYVEFYYEYQFNRTELNKFICNNPQLKQISISSHNLDESVINSILALKSLYKLEILFSGAEVDGINIHTENCSIKHFVYTGTRLVDYNVTIGVLEKCKNIKVYQTSYISDYDSVIGSEFPEVDTLLLSNVFHQEIDPLAQKFTKFNQVKFRGGCKFSYIADQLLSYPGIKWVPKQEYTRGTNEFTLVRKSV